MLEKKTLEDFNNSFENLITVIKKNYQINMKTNLHY